MLLGCGDLTIPTSAIVKLTVLRKGYFLPLPGSGTRSRTVVLGLSLVSFTAMNWPVLASRPLIEVSRSLPHWPHLPRRLSANHVMIGTARQGSQSH